MFWVREKSKKKINYIFQVNSQTHTVQLIMPKKHKRDRDLSSSDSESSDSSSEDDRKQRERSPARSGSGSDSSSSSDSASSSSASDSSSSEEERRKKKKKKHKHKKKARKKTKKHKKSKKKKKKGKKSKKKKKKSKHGDNSSSTLSMNDRWGQSGFGLCREADIHNKEAEYYAWLYEIKGVSRENLNRWEEKSMFREYCEDYNTGTFPDEKYYDLGRWQAKNQLEMKQTANVFNSRLSDEERLRIERQQQNEAQSKAQDDLRMAAMVKALKEGKEKGTDRYQEIARRHAPTAPKPTFESIAAERLRKKRETENTIKNQYKY